MARLTDEEKSFIKQYVDSKYYDIEKLLSYLEMHQMVGNEIFTYVYKDNWGVRGEKAYCSYLDTEAGYYPLSVASFIQKIPFFFYHYDEETHENFGTFEDVCEDYLSTIHYGNHEDIMDMQNDLVYLFYEKKISLPDIFNYCRRQIGNIGGGMFRYWVDYIKKCDALKHTDYMPECFIAAYNEVKERLGEEPTIFSIHMDDQSMQYFYRNDLKITFRGMFPHDGNGHPIMKWIGLKVDDPDEIWCDMEKSHVGELHVTLNPDTTIDCLDAIGDMFDRGNWKRIYTGPQKMTFNSNALKIKRKAMKLNQKEVADAIGANVRTYQKWENGETIPDGYNLLKLMNWLNLSDPLSLIIQE